MIQGGAQIATGVLQKIGYGKPLGGTVGITTKENILNLRLKQRWKSRSEIPLKSLPSQLWRLCQPATPGVSPTTALSRCQKCPASMLGERLTHHLTVL